MQLLRIKNFGTLQHTDFEIVWELRRLWQAWSCHHSVGPEQATIQNGQRNLASRRVQASLSVSTERSTAQMVKETVQPGPSKTRKFATCFASFTHVHRLGSFWSRCMNASNLIGLNGFIRFPCCFHFQAAKMAKTKCGSSRPRVAARCKAWQLQHQTLPGDHMETKWRPQKKTTKKGRE